MSGVSPSRSIRLRAKTSELTDFFRGSGHSTGQPQRTRKDSMTGPSQNLEVPLSGDESATGTKKITRIPLFGRSRKKSNQSAASSPFASSCINRESSDGGEQSSASRGPSTDRCVQLFFTFLFGPLPYALVISVPVPLICGSPSAMM